MTPAAARFGRPQGIPLARHGAQPSFLGLRKNVWVILQFVWVARIFLPLASPADREGGEGEKNATGLAGLVLAWALVCNANGVAWGC
jgi:hypothetical protein